MDFLSNIPALILAIAFVGGLLWLIDSGFSRPKKNSAVVTAKKFHRGFQTLSGYHQSSCSIDVEMLGKKVRIHGLQKGYFWKVDVCQPVTVEYVRGRLSGHIYVREFYPN